MKITKRRLRSLIDEAKYIGTYMHDMHGGSIELEIGDDEDARERIASKFAEILRRPIDRERIQVKKVIEGEEEYWKSWIEASLDSLEEAGFMIENLLHGGHEVDESDRQDLESAMFYMSKAIVKLTRVISE